MKRTVILPVEQTNSAIREVVLRGSASFSEQHQLTRSVIYLRRQLGCEQIWLRPQVSAPEVTVSLHDWSNSSAQVPSFDRLLDSVMKAGSVRLVLWTKDWLAGAHSAVEVLNRYQRFLPLLPAQLRDELPSAPAEALDVWRWVLRLRPHAGRALRLAALTQAPAALREVQSAGDSTLLRDAGDISFFAMQSWSYLRAWGEAETVETTLRRLQRMTELALCHALATRQPAVISATFERYFEGRARAQPPFVATAGDATAVA